jgi:hypothetical protein
MSRVIETIEFWKHAAPSSGGLVILELDGSLSSVETLWRMVLGMAMKDRAWCIHYDVKHPLRLLYVTSCSVYGLVPPPDDMAEAVVRAIDRVTRPTFAIGQLFSRFRAFIEGRVTRSFAVKYEGETVGWVASWPRRASCGPVVVFRESYPGWDPSKRPVDEAALRLEDERVRQKHANSWQDVGDSDGNTR